MILYSSFSQQIQSINPTNKHSTYRTRLESHFIFMTLYLTWQNEVLQLAFDLNTNNLWLHLALSLLTWNDCISSTSPKMKKYTIKKCATNQLFNFTHNTKTKKYSNQNVQMIVTEPQEKHTKTHLVDLLWNIMTLYESNQILKSIHYL